MSPTYIVVLVLELAVLSSLFLSGRWRVSKLFVAYILAVIGPDLLFAVAPSTFVWSAWAAKEVALVVLKLALAIELVLLAFAGLHEAKASGERWIALVLIWTLGRLAFVHLDGFRASFAVWMPILNDATVAAFGVAIAHAIWYRVPLHPLHKAILEGLAFFLVGSSFAIYILGATGWTQVQRDLIAVGYGIVTVHWLVAIWRREEVPDPIILRELRPWA